MTKLYKVNYKNGEELPIEYNDAHAALRGFASSKLNSSLVLSAGMSPRLYSYLESFNDFFPDEKGVIKENHFKGKRFSFGFYPGKNDGCQRIVDF